jgi:hypothetical protein
MLKKNDQMQIQILTDSAEALLDAVYGKIESGDVKTWERITLTIGKKKDVDALGYKAPQYAGIASLVPIAQGDMLVITIIQMEGQPTLNNATRAIYYGRFTEVIMSHFYGKYNINSINIV